MTETTDRTRLIRFAARASTALLTVVFVAGVAFLTAMAGTPTSASADATSSALAIAVAPDAIVACTAKVPPLSTVSDPLLSVIGTATDEASTFQAVVLAVLPG